MNIKSSPRTLCLTSLPLILSLLFAPATSAQRVRTAKLTDSEIEAVRENAVFPVMRVQLYTRFLEERAAKIKDLTGRPRSAQRVLKLDDALQDFTAMLDEMGSNLDQYSDRHSDIRKALQPLSEAAPKWLSTPARPPRRARFRPRAQRSDRERRRTRRPGHPPHARAGRLFRHPQRRKRPGAGRRCRGCKNCQAAMIHPRLET